VALAEPAQRVATGVEQGVDPQLADALDHLLGAIGNPASEGGENAVQDGLSDRARVRPRRVLGFLRLLVARFRYSHRRRYRIARRVFVWLAKGSICAGVVVILFWFFTHS